MKGNDFTGINQSGSSILRSMIVVVVTPIPGVLQTPEVVLPLEDGTMTAAGLGNNGACPVRLFYTWPGGFHSQ